jgi:hypothetical protein
METGEFYHDKMATGMGIITTITTTMGTVMETTTITMAPIRALSTSSTGAYSRQV